MRLCVPVQAVSLVLGDLSDEAHTVIGAELLLAALEACGVDNARCGSTADGSLGVAVGTGA